MTLSEFNLLPKQQQELVIFGQSNFLHVETKDGLKYGLYAKDNFFIEVICFEDSLAVKEVNAFERGYLISKYSNRITPRLQVVFKNCLF
jgi:hypothetical protein